MEGRVTNVQVLMQGACAFGLKEEIVVNRTHKVIVQVQVKLQVVGGKSLIKNFS